MKTLLSTSALAAFLVSGVALADGPGMKGDRSSKHGMSGPQSQMQTDGKHHMGKEMHDGKGREYSSGRYVDDDDDDDRRGETRRGEDRYDRDEDDDNRGERHMKHMDRDHS